jgi:DTW domain-containing protein YfiP
MRERCKQCLKVKPACYCHTITPYKNIKKIIILMHPSEKGHALGTASMAKLTFEKISIFIGESFEDNLDLKELLATEKCALFKPSNDASPYEQCHQEFDTLIFIDGTWKKANKIYFLNSFLHTIPQVSFESGAKSRYRLRKEPKSNYLSTFESVVKAFEISDKTDLSKHLSPLDYVQNFQDLQKSKPQGL